MDYIIIQKDGNPSTFGGITIPFNKDGRDTIVVYGNREDVENDFNENCDLGIAELVYSYSGKKCITKVSFGGKEIGEFTHDCFRDDADAEEAAFQEKLWDFVILCDFEAYQLPH